MLLFEGVFYKLFVFLSSVFSFFFFWYFPLGIYLSFGKRLVCFGFSVSFPLFVPDGILVI